MVKVTHAACRTVYKTGGKCMLALLLTLTYTISVGMEKMQAALRYKQYDTDMT